MTLLCFPFTLTLIPLPLYFYHLPLYVYPLPLPLLLYPYPYIFTLYPSICTLYPYPYPYTLTLIFLPFTLRFLPFTLTLKPVLCCLAMYFPQCCESGCPRVPRKPIAITADANPQVPPGCPLNSANAGPATFWRGAPRAVPWGIINIKEVETSRGAPRHPSGCSAVHAGH